MCFRWRLKIPIISAAKRVVLVGEAAHVLPPIGAQGLNMGLRDAADLAEIVRDALLMGGDPGDGRRAATLCARAARRCVQPDLRGGHGEPHTAQRFPARASRCAPPECTC